MTSLGSDYSGESVAMLGREQHRNNSVGGNIAAVTDWLGRTTASASAMQRTAGDDPSSGRLVLTLTGWRRKCLFGLLLTLTVIVVINLSLTLWLLRSMQFSLVR